MIVDVPALHLEIGDREVAEVVGLQLFSEADKPLDWLEVEVDNRDGEAGVFAVDDEVSLWLGYAGTSELPLVFTGTVAEVRRGRNVYLEVVDQGRQLRDLEVVKSWVNVAPAEVVADVFVLAGSDRFTTTLVDYPRRPHFVAAGLTGLQVVDAVTAAWGLDWQLWWDAHGAAWVGPWIESPRWLTADVLQFEAGEDVLALDPSEDQKTGRLHIFCRPELRHSQILALRDDRFGLEPVLVRAEKVIHRLGEAGKHRGYTTEVEWKRLDSLS